MEKALKIKINELVELFDDINQGMRINYYPRCHNNPHSDMGMLTILLQANDIEGLQIIKD